MPQIESRMEPVVNPHRAKVIPLAKRTLTDPQIVDGVRRGDPAAGWALVDRFGPLIDRRVWRLMGGDSEHRDIVQQVFQQLVGTLHRLDDSQALGAWVEKLTINVVRKEFRRRKYRRIVQFSTVDAEIAMDDATEDVTIEKKVLILRAYDILKRMNVEDRIAFTLRFIEEMPLADVAEATGCSLATAKRRIRRGRETFMKKARRDPFLVSLTTQDESP